MTRAGVIRFLITPAEAWLRAVAMLSGGRVFVGHRGVGETEFAIDLNADGTRMRIRINEEQIVIGRAEVSRIVADLNRVLDEMRDEP